MRQTTCVSLKMVKWRRQKGNAFALIIFDCGPYHKWWKEMFEWQQWAFDLRPHGCCRHEMCSRAMNKLIAHLCFHAKFKCERKTVAVPLKLGIMSFICGNYEGRKKLQFVECSQTFRMELIAFARVMMIFTCKGSQTTLVTHYLRKIHSWQFVTASRVPKIVFVAQIWWNAPCIRLCIWVNGENSLKMLLICIEVSNEKA